MTSKTSQKFAQGPAIVQYETSKKVHDTEYTKLKIIAVSRLTAIVYFVWSRNASDNKHEEVRHNWDILLALSYWLTG